MSTAAYIGILVWVTASWRLEVCKRVRLEGQLRRLLTDLQVKGMLVDYAEQRREAADYGG